MRETQREKREAETETKREKQRNIGERANPKQRQWERKIKRAIWKQKIGDRVRDRRAREKENLSYILRLPTFLCSNPVRPLAIILSFRQDIHIYVDRYIYFHRDLLLLSYNDKNYFFWSKYPYVYILIWEIIIVK